MSMHSAEPLLRPQPIRPSAVAGGRPARKRRKVWIWSGVAVIALAGAGIGTKLFLDSKGKAGQPAIADSAANAKKSNALTVTTVRAESAEVSRTLAVNGSLAAWDELPIGTQVSGLAIVEVRVEEGDRVKAGQLLARFDDSVLRADLASKDASLHEAEAVAIEADANIKRAEDLIRTGAISNRDLDARRSAALTARARVSVAKAAREQSVVRLAQTEIRSPVDGTVSLRNARLGAVMAAGGTELFRIIRDDRVEMLAEVPEVELRAMAVGQKVELGANDGEGKPFVGTVRIVSPTVDPKTRLGLARVDVPASPLLRPGMFMSARIKTYLEKLPTIPEAALVYVDAKPVVMVVDPATEDGNHRVHVREVRAGSRDKGRIAITSGLAVGDEIVLTGAGYLKEGDLVVIGQADNAPPVKPLPVAQ